MWVNPCPAELFELYFSSFEAGIAKQFPASNDEKIKNAQNRIYPGLAGQGLMSAGMRE